MTIIMSKFIVLEGPDGSGKSTQVRLLKDSLDRLGYRVIIIREPGGTTLGEELRRITKDHDIPKSPLATTLLYYAARAQLADYIRDRLEDDVWVISDRWELSTLVYQNVVNGVPIQKILSISITLSLPKPDHVVVLNTSDTDSLIDRITSRDNEDNHLLPYIDRISRVYDNDAREYCNMLYGDKCKYSRVYCGEDKETVSKLILGEVL